MRSTTLWRDLLGVEKNTVIDEVDYDEDAHVITAHAHPSRKLKPRCGICHARSPRYDQGEGRRKWRALDLGTIPVWIEACAPRVTCPSHGVTVAQLPWARHGAGHTHAFDQQVAWLATKTSKSAVTELMRIAWRTVGAIIDRVWADAEQQSDRFAGLRRIGIDEVSYKKGHKYLMVVVDHDTRNLVWTAPGRTKATLREFFTMLGPERSALITHVSADGADFIDTVVTEQCPNAIIVADPFHVVKWANDALDQVRREAWNDARKLAQQEPKRPRGRPAADAPDRPHAERVKGVKGARFALLKNPEDLTCGQTATLAWLVTADPKLHRAYLLKEALRAVFKMPLAEARDALDGWVLWARRSRIEVFVKLQRSIVKHRDRILASIEHGLSNGLVEATNTKVRLITRIAYGFKSTDALIALVMLSLGAHRPKLPGRA